MLKQIDDVGRIVIPMSFRQELNIDKKSFVDIELSTDSEPKQIIIKRSVCRCDICGSEEKIETVLGQNICSKCSEKLKEYYNN